MICAMSCATPRSFIGLLLTLALLGCIDRSASGEADAIAPEPPEPPCRVDGECDDDNPCTDDRCEPTFGCVFQPHLRACDDGDRCTEGESCSAGRCVGGAPRACDDGDGCTADRCDPEAGCVHEALPAGTWASTVVDDVGDVGAFSSLHVAADGTLHVAYRDERIRGLRHGRRAPGWPWTTAPVGDMPAGFYAAAALDPEGRVHIVSLDRDERLMHAVGEPDWRISWHAPVDEHPVAIDVDPSGRAHIAFYDAHERVRLATWSEGAEGIALEADGLGPGERWGIDLIVDPVGRDLYVISHRHDIEPHGAVEVASRSLDGGQWRSEIVAASTQSSWRADAFAGAVDPDGRLHLTLLLNGTLRYAVKEASGVWRNEAPLGELALAEVTLALDAAGRPLIAYTVRRGSSLDVLVGDGAGGWIDEQVDARPGPNVANGAWFDDPSPAFDPLDETWHMTYRDTTRRDLRHARRCR